MVKTLRPCSFLFLITYFLLNAAISAQDLLVLEQWNFRILRFDGQTGAPLGEFTSPAGLLSATDMTFGPDGHLYATHTGPEGDVLRFDGVTGQFLNAVIPDRPLPFGNIRTFTFAPNGNLLVVSSWEQQPEYRLMEYDRSTGTFLRFLSDPGILKFPNGMTVGPNGDVYIGDADGRRGGVKRFDYITTEYLGVFTSQQIIAYPYSPTFGPNGNLYVAAVTADRVFEFDGQTGDLIGSLDIASNRLDTPRDLFFDVDGTLLVANGGQNRITRFDATTGEFLENFVKKDAGGLSNPRHCVYQPAAQFRIERLEPGIAGEPNTISVVGAQPGGLLALGYGFVLGNSQVPNCPQAALDFQHPQRIVHDTANPSGYLTKIQFVPAVLSGITAYFQAVDFSGCQVTPLYSVTFQ